MEKGGNVDTDMFKDITREFCEYTLSTQVEHCPSITLEEAIYTIDINDPRMDKTLIRINDRPLAEWRDKNILNLDFANVTNQELYSILDSLLMTWMCSHSFIDTLMPLMPLHHPCDIDDFQGWIIENVLNICYWTASLMQGSTVVIKEDFFPNLHGIRSWQCLPVPADFAGTDVFSEASVDRMIARRSLCISRLFYTLKTGNFSLQSLERDVSACHALFVDGDGGAFLYKECIRETLSRYHQPMLANLYSQGPIRPPVAIHTPTQTRDCWRSIFRILLDSLLFYAKDGVEAKSLINYHFMLFAEDRPFNALVRGLLATILRNPRIPTMQQRGFSEMERNAVMISLNSRFRSPRLVSKMLFRSSTLLHDLDTFRLMGIWMILCNLKLEIYCEYELVEAYFCLSRLSQLCEQSTVADHLPLSFTQMCLANTRYFSPGKYSNRGNSNAWSSTNRLLSRWIPVWPLMYARENGIDSDIDDDGCLMKFMLDIDSVMSGKCERISRLERESASFYRLDDILNAFPKVFITLP